MNRKEKRQKSFALQKQYSNPVKRTFKRLKMKKNEIQCYFCDEKVGNIHIGQLDVTTNCICICPNCLISEQFFITKYKSQYNPNCIIEMSNGAIAFISPDSAFIQYFLEYKKCLQELEQ